MAAAVAKPDPSTPSADHNAMKPYWDKASSILGGIETMRQAGEKYLPKFEEEKKADYEVRLKNARLTNIFGDIVQNLAQKPFARQVDLIVPDEKDKAKEAERQKDEIEEFCENVDGAGNHLHVFAGDVFHAGIAFAIDWILVDHTKVKPMATVEEEKKAGARPYWVRIPAVNMLAVYSAMVDGEEQFVYARIFEPVTVRDGDFGEKTIERVRILIRDASTTKDEVNADKVSYGPARFEVHEKRLKVGTTDFEWVKVDFGPITIGVIALVPFITGRRKGASWQVTPPMRDAADLQIELYQQETKLKWTSDMTAFPMLAANGVAPQIGPDNKPLPVPVGPFATLYAPMSHEGKHGRWEILEISAESLKFLAAGIEATSRELRELGRQPLTAQTGNLTVVTTTFAAQKGNSAAQSWALNLKDALERAITFTKKWLRSEAGPSEVSVYTDFGIDTDSVEGMKVVLEMKKAALISRDAAITEAKRRNVLAPEYDADEDLEQILKDQPGEEDEEIDEKTGLPKKPPVVPKKPAQAPARV